jgi:heptosyltransferase-2
MPSNILIRGVNWIGDAVMTMPALRAIRRAMPGSNISLLVKPWVSPLFNHDPSVDEIIPYEDRHGKIKSRLMLAGSLKSRGFSSAILFQNAFDAALIAYLAGIPRRVGYARDMRGFLLTDPIPYKDEDRGKHHTEYYLELLRRAGIDAPPSESWLYLEPGERLLAREKLSGLRRPVVGINPGATFGSAKQWLPERFAEVAKYFMDELDGSAVIFGSPTEAGIAEDILSRSGERPEERLISLAGKTSLRELASLISECDLLLSNDSGPMHIGYAVKTPLVAIFGSTDPSLTGPPEKGNIVIRKDMDCGPCFLRRCPKTSIRCMEAVTSEETISSIKNLLPSNRAVFFDRDGTLMEDTVFVKDWDEVKVFSDISNLILLINKDFRLIGISNQSGIARGIVDEAFVREVNECFIRNYGFDGFYYCPHHPEEGCACRKPSPEMLMRARAEHAIDLKGSFVVGDRDIDMLLARAVGAGSVLVQTGKQRESPYADYIARDLSDAAEWILRKSV